MAPFPVHKLEVLRCVAFQQPSHGVLVDPPPPDDGDARVGHVGVVIGLEIALDEDPHRRPRPRQGDEGGPVPLLLPNLPRHAPHGLRRDARVAGERILIGMEIGRGRLILDGEHLIIGRAALDLSLPRLGAQGFDLAGDVLEQQRHVIPSIASKHSLPPVCRSSACRSRQTPGPGSPGGLFFSCRRGR